MTNANQIIDALGGIVRVASALSLSPSTVSSWKSAKGGIPRWWHRDVKALARKEKIDIPALTPERAA